MILHPLLLSVTALDLAGLLFLGSALPAALRVVLEWSPGSCAEKQLRLEREAETSSIRARACLGLWVLSTLVLAFGVTAVLPGLVPGAMCAEGVFQAAGGVARQSVFLRGFSLALLGLWHLLDRLNRARPEAPITVWAARALLAAVPVVLLAFLTTFRAFHGLDTHEPVSCCTRVYDSFQSLTGTAGAGGFSDTFRVAAFVAGAIFVPAWGVSVGASAVGNRVLKTGVLAVAVVLWVPAAYGALVRVLAAYHYGVLQHHCPWCLFLPEHRFVGYPLFFFLFAVFLEGTAALACSIIAREVPSLVREARLRERRAGWRVAAAALLFSGLAGLPAVLWRLRFGVWIG